jgi:hypothetical protein
MDSFALRRLWRTCMSKLATKLIAICFILGWNVHASSQEKAEEFLSEYFHKYDDSYQEFALAYRAEAFSVRKAGQEVKERLLVYEGLVAESASRNIRYAAWKTSEPTVSRKPVTMEELTIGGKLFSKQYGTIGNTSEIEATRWGVPSDTNPTPKIIPCLQPHGLALLQDRQFVGRESDLRKCVPMFLRHMEFVKQIDLQKDGVRGVWMNTNKAYPYGCTIDFSPDEHHLPIKVKWEFEGNPALGKAKSTTITKWKKEGDLHVPEKIEISSQLGEGTTEMSLEFVFLKKERFEKEIKEIPTDFAEAKGTAWIDRFKGWFENER